MGRRSKGGGEETPAQMAMTNVFLTVGLIPIGQSR